VHLCVVGSAHLCDAEDTGGEVENLGESPVVPGEVRQLFAKPYPNYIFYRWHVTEGAEFVVVADPFASQTTYVVSDAKRQVKILAEFAPQQMVVGQSPKARFFFGPKDGTRLKLRKVPCAVPPIDPAVDSVSVIIDGNVFELNPQEGRFFRRNGWLRYRSTKNGSMRWRFDENREIWYFSTNRRMQAPLSEPNIANVVLSINGVPYGIPFDTSDFARFRGKSEPSDEEADPSTLRTAYRYRNDQTAGNRIHASCRNLLFPDDFSFDPETEYASVSVGGIGLDVKPGGFVLSRGGTYVYRDKEQGVRMNLNPGRKTWSAWVRNRVFVGKIDTTEDFPTYLTVGNHEWNWNVQGKRSLSRKNAR
jgi:hypothetical protein